MSAKPKKGARPSPGPSSASPAPAVPSPAVTANPIGASTAAATADVGWIDSSDPRKRQIGKIVLAAVWIYVAALWLLALDQTFHWGIFGPKVPPLP